MPFGFIQFVLSVEPQLTLGTDGLLPTTDSHVAVQPVLISVTVTVYVPAVKLLILDVVAPSLHI